MPHNCRSFGKANTTVSPTSQFALRHQTRTTARTSTLQPVEMRIQVAIAAAALTIASTMDSAHGLAKYMQEFPNGDVLGQKFGHPGGATSQRTDFAKAFATAGHTWSNSLCEAKFPGSSMTNGEALGDPCCTWKKGGKPDFTVAAFTTTPTKATTCAAKSGASTTSSAAAAGKTSKSAGSSSSGTADNGTSADSAATKGDAATADSSSQAANATKGGVATGESSSGVGDATKGAWDATKGDSETTGSTAVAATKGSPWGSSPAATPASTTPSANPTLGGGCAAKKTRKLRR
jgi:hypothetical protein